MSSIRIDFIPQTDISLRPHWVGQEMVGIKISIVGERSNAEMFAVTPQAIIDGLKTLGREHAIDWWELYFEYRALRDGMPVKSGVMMFAAIDCTYFP